MPPCWLTQEFLRGRRASYTPPFRMYLILSMLFFGRVLTLLKFLLLGVGYFVFMTLTVLGLLTYTALTL